MNGLKARAACLQTFQTAAPMVSYDLMAVEWVSMATLFRPVTPEHLAAPLVTRAASLRAKTKVTQPPPASLAVQSHYLA